VAAYYNEFKPEAAHMLRQLIKDGLIADGEVDERSIVDVRADDLRNFTQCHFFAGIGGWSVALRLAMWPDSRPVWTGSCPCQPFSTAGKGKGHGDERHLWPHWSRLISECKPPIVFGEQVASAITYGWWDDVAADLEAQDYACAAAVLPACSVGKPHKRDRLWFVAQSYLKRERRGMERQPTDNTQEDGERADHRLERPSGTTQVGQCTMGNAEHDGPSRTTQLRRNETDGNERRTEEPNIPGKFTGAGGPANVPSLQRGQDRGKPEHVADTEGGEEQSPATKRFHPEPSAEGNGSIGWIACPDGKSRPVEPSICLLAHGVQHRAPVLHAFGNAIVPQVAAEFIKAAGVK